MKPHRTNVVIAAVLIAIGALLLAVVIPAQVQEEDSPGLSPRLLPEVCALLVIAFSAVLGLQSMTPRRGEGEVLGSLANPLQGLRTLIMVLLVWLYVNGIGWIGYYPATALALLAAMAIFGEVRWRHALAVLTGALLVIWFGFDLLLRVRLAS